MSITLHYAPDNASLVVRTVLEELDLRYEAVLVDRAVRAHKSDAFLALNPNGVIPVCILDGEPVFETAAIILTLAERTGLMVPDVSSPDRPVFLKWLFWLSNTLHKDLKLIFYPEQYVGHDPAHKTVLDSLSRPRLAARLTVLDDAYSERDGPFLFGNAPTVADVYAAYCLRWPQIYPARYRGDITLAPYPHLLRMARAFEQRPAVIRACAMEGITDQMVSAPDYADPKEGSALG